MAKRNVEGPAGQAPASSPAPRDSQPSREYFPTLNHLFGGKSKECESRKLSISDHNVSSLKMQSEAREASQRNCNNASILTKGLIAYLKQCSDTQEIGGSEEAGEPPCARWGSSCHSNRAILEMRPGMFVNKDTELRQHIRFLFQPIVYLQRNVIGIILHFQVR